MAGKVAVTVDRYTCTATSHSASLVATA
jgi:hypothetical protein